MYLLERIDRRYRCSIETECGSTHLYRLFVSVLGDPRKEKVPALQKHIAGQLQWLERGKVPGQKAILIVRLTELGELCPQLVDTRDHLGDPTLIFVTCYPSPSGFQLSLTAPIVAALFSSARGSFCIVTKPAVRRLGI